MLVERGGRALCTADDPHGALADEKGHGQNGSGRSVREGRTGQAVRGRRRVVDEQRSLVAQDPRRQRIAQRRRRAAVELAVLVVATAQEERVHREGLPALPLDDLGDA